MDAIYLVQSYPLDIHEAYKLCEFIKENFGENRLIIQKDLLTDAKIEEVLS